MLKKFLVVFALSAILATPVLARDDSTTSSGDLKGRFFEKLQQIKVTAREKKITSVSDRLCKLKKDRVVEFNRQADLVSKRLLGVQTDTTKAKTAGRDVSGVELLLATAQTDIASAKTAISALSTQSCVSLTDTDAQAQAQSSLNNLNSSFKNINSLLDTARTAVSDAAKALRTVLGGATHE